ncbi:MAG: hypothetical protein RIC55_08635 [Pirellulaceae bacterium]
MQTSVIERAIFTSAQSGRLDGYQLVAASDGVSDDVRRELTRWGPAHDSLLGDDDSAESINFHQLRGGDFCVSQTVHAGGEYSGRGGWRVYTQLLLVPPQALACFANNPFRLHEAAVAAGYLDVLPAIPDQLEAIHLTGGATPVDRILLARLARQPGARQVAVLLDQALTHERLAVQSRTPLARLLAGLFSLLPVELRAAFSFTTGLKPSSQRVFRWQPIDPEQYQPQARRRPGEPFPLVLNDVADGGELHPWAELAQQVLADGCIASFCQLLRTSRRGLQEEALPELASSLAEQLARSSRPLATPSPVGG